MCDRVIKFDTLPYYLPTASHSKTCPSPWIYHVKPPPDNTSTARREGTSPRLCALRGSNSILKTFYGLTQSFQLLWCGNPIVLSGLKLALTCKRFPLCV